MSRHIDLPKRCLADRYLPLFPALTLGIPSTTDKLQRAMKPITLAKRAQTIPASPIRKLAPLAAAAEQSGIRVYRLNIGQPDILSPKEFFDGVRRYSDPIVSYDPSKGSEYLCRSWSEYMNRTLSLQTTPEQFLITLGASEAIIFTFLACCDPDDEVIVFDPTYANYLGFAAMADVRLVSVPSSIHDGFRLPPNAEIEKRITKKTRAILVCNPNNPTGTVYTRDEAQRLVDLCRERNLFLLADETYREFVYDGSEPFSVLHIAADDDRIVVLDSLSKRFSLCGARLGCLLTTNQDLLAKCLRLAQARLSAPSIEQFAAAHMLETIENSFVESIRREYKLRRDTLLAALQNIPGVEAHKPGGAFYAVVRLPVKNTDEFASFLLRDFAHEGETVFVAPASGFYVREGCGLDEVRVAYVLTSSDIERSVAALAAGLRAYHD